MDPVSAAVTAVGFAASLATLVSLVTESSRVLHNLWDKVRDTPKEVERLLDVVRITESLVKEIAGLIPDDSEDVPAMLQEIWNARAGLMLVDMRGLGQVVLELQNSIEGKTISRKHIRTSIRKFFKDDKILSYERKLSKHIETFTLVLSMLSASQSGATLKAVQQVQTSQHLNYRHLEALILQISSSSQYALQHLNSNFADISQNLNMLESGLLPVINTGGDANQLQPYKAVLPLHSSGSKTAASWQWSSYQLPIGDLSMSVFAKPAAEENGETSGRGPARKNMELTFAPSSWISRNVVKISLAIESAQYGGPGFKWGLSQAYNNPNPLLIQALRNTDLSTLQRMFTNGLARPTDVVSEWRRSLLHEILFCYLADLPGSIEICHFLIRAGADLNARSADGSTPLLLCCKLMKNGRLEQKLQTFSTVLLSAGADPTLLDAEGNSAVSMIFNAAEGLNYLQSCFYKFIDIIRFQEISSRDTWILAAIARSVPNFHVRLQKQLEDFHTPWSISSFRTRTSFTIIGFDLNHQISEIKNTDDLSRASFMRGLCGRGTASMLEPLVRFGLDVNEGNNGELSYLGEAANTANHETLSVLLNAGADINRGTTYSPIDVLLERWVTLNNTSVPKTQVMETITNEWPVFEQLVKTPGIRSTGALIRAIHLRHDECVEYLLRSGFGRKVNEMPHGYYVWSGGEVVEAVKHKNAAALKLLIKYQVGLDFEDREGYTALMHCLDKGYTELFKILVEGGAHLTHRTSAGFSAKDLARRNATAAHPRKPTLRGVFGYTDHMRPVTQEEDLEAYALITQKLENIQEQASDTAISKFSDLISTCTHTSEKLTNDVAIKYSHIRTRLSKVSLPEAFFVASGLVLALAALILFQVYEAIWWAINARRAPKPLHILSLIALSLLIYEFWP